MTSQRAINLAPWSNSKIQTALRCPKLFHYRYIDKIKEPEVLPDTRIGKAVHLAIEKALLGNTIEVAVEDGSKILANQDEDDRYRRICSQIPAYLKRIRIFRERFSVQRQFVEHRLAMDLEGNSTAFSSKGAFFRGIVDAAYSYGNGCFALVDHKSGLRQPNAKINEQLEGYAVLAKQYFRGVRKIVLGVHWVASGDLDWGPPLNPDIIQNSLYPTLLASIDAAALAVADGPRPQESSWCLRCSYRSICPQAQIARFVPEEEPNPGLE